MCNCKMCNWLKSLFGKKCNCEEKGCCEEKKVEETATPIAPVTPTEELKEEPVVPVTEEKTEEQA